MLPHVPRFARREGFAADRSACRATHQRETSYLADRTNFERRSLATTARTRTSQEEVLKLFQTLGMPGSKTPRGAQLRCTASGYWEVIVQRSLWTAFRCRRVHASRRCASTKNEARGSCFRSSSCPEATSVVTTSTCSLVEI